MHTTKAMSIRNADDLSIPHVDSNNNIIGTINPLKMFVCQHGVSGIGCIESVNKHYAAVDGTTIAVAADGLISTDGIEWDFQNNISDSGTDELAADFDAAATTDLLIIASGQLDTALHATDIVLGLRDNSSFCTVSTRAATGGGINPGYFSEATPTAVQGAVDPGPNVVNATTYVLYNAVDRSGNFIAGRNDGSIASAVEVVGDVSSATAEMDYAAPFLQTKGKIYAMGIFHFPNNTLPANYKAMANWMAWNWAAGNYVFPANWRNL